MHICRAVEYDEGKFERLYETKAFVSRRKVICIIRFYIWRLSSNVGDSCGELSFIVDREKFKQQLDKKKDGFAGQMRGFENKKSQLGIIFDVLGTPTDKDLEFMDKKTVQFLHLLPRKAPTVAK